MIYTGSYDNCQSGRLVSISGDGGKKIGFNGEKYKKLAPKLSFWQVWHDNIGKRPAQENNLFYMREYYEQVLRHINVKEILQKFKNGVIFMCYEPIDINYNPIRNFCHRHEFATWFELETGIIVSEIAIDNENNITELQRPIAIIDDFKQLIYKK